MKAVIEGAHTALEEAGSLDLLEDGPVLLKLPKGLKEGLDAISRLKEHATRLEKLHLL
jgi:hypothetical protein